MAHQPPTLGDIHAALGGELVGDASLLVCRIAPLASATMDSVSFIAHERYRSQLAHTGAAALIVPAALAAEAGQRASLIVTSDPYFYFARLTQWWAARARSLQAAPTIHPSAHVAPDAMWGTGVGIGAGSVVEAGVRLGDDVQIGAQCFVGAGVSIGAGTRLAPGVRLMPGTTLGARCLLHSGVVIGADGFGFAPHQGRWEKIEQLGGVRIGDDVEIGANTCVDRGALDDTVIEDGVKLDNLIQIGHNVHVGAHSAMAGCAGVAGSARIGKGCTVGGGAVVLGHLELAEGVHISAASVVTRSLRKPGLYSGVFPLDENAAWEKNAATLRQLHSLRDRVRALERAQSPASIQSGGTSASTESLETEKKTS